MPGFVLIYDTQDGCQPELYSTEEKALRGAARVIAQEIDAVDDDECRREINAALVSENFAKAFSLLQGYPSDTADFVKAISITDLEIDQHDSDDPIPIRLCE